MRIAFTKALVLTEKWTIAPHLVLAFIANFFSERLPRLIQAILSAPNWFKKKEKEKRNSYLYELHTRLKIRWVTSKFPIHKSLDGWQNNIGFLISSRQGSKRYNE